MQKFSGFKPSILTALILGAISTHAYSAPNVEGTAVGKDSVAYGQSSVTTANQGVSQGYNAVATGDNLSRAEFEKLNQEYLAKLKEKENLQNQLSGQKATLAQAEKDVDQFTKDLAAIDVAIAKNKADADKNAKLNEQIGKLIVDNGINGSQVSQFVNYYDVLSSLDWNQYSSSATGLNYMVSQLKDKTTSYAPAIAATISDDKYAEFIKGYVNVETTMSSTLDDIKKHLNNTSDSLIQRAANKGSINDFIASKANNIIADNYLSKDYIDNLNLKENTAISAYDLTYLAAESIKANSSNTEFNRIINLTSQLKNDRSKISFSTTTLNDINRLDGNASWSSVFKYGYNLNSRYLSEGMFYNKAHSGFNNLSQVLDTFYRGMLNSNYTISDSVNVLIPIDNGYLNATFFEKGLAFEATNPLINEMTDGYSAFLTYINTAISAYENIDTTKASAYDAEKVKQKLAPIYAKYKEAQEILTDYFAIQNMENGTARQAAQAAYVERLNKFRTGDSLAFLKSYQGLENSLSNETNLLEITTDEYKQYLRDGIKSWKEYLLSEEPNLIGYDRNDEYISQLESTAKQIENLRNQLVDIDTTPERDSTAQKLNEAQKEVERAKDAIRDAEGKIDAIKSTLPEVGHNSIAVGNQSFASGNSAIAIGNLATAIGDNSIVLGNTSLATGENSIAIGSANQVTGNLSVAIGTGNTIAQDNTFALGNNVTSTQVNSVILGNDSTDRAVIGVPSIKIQGTTYKFAGTNPIGVVSVGTEGKERQIINVAAGRIAADSTDAINGSQLYAVTTALNAIEALDLGDITNKLANITTHTGNINFTDGKNNAEVEPDGALTINGDNKYITTTVNPDDKSLTISLDASKLPTSTGSTLGGIKFTDGDNITTIANGEILQINGDDKNITVTVNPDDQSATIKLSDDIDVNSVIANKANIGPVSIDDKGINAGDKKITGIADGELSPTSTDAVNGSQLYATNINVTNNTNTIAKGFNVATDDGSSTNYQLGDTVTITGDDKNISTVTEDGKTRVKLADDINVNSVTTGDVSISTKGVNAGNKKVTNVAAGEVSPTSTDAVNGSQLYATNQVVIDNSRRITNVEGAVTNLDNRVGKVENKVRKLDKQRKAGTAAAIATANLMQPHQSGRSMVTAAAGQYQGQTAVAVGYSRLSDNGKLGFRVSVNANTQNELGAGVGVGYQW